jgi:hypothetical protein
MQLQLLGWNQGFQAQFLPFAAAGLIPGRIVQQFNHIFTVATERGELRAELAGRLRREATEAGRPVTGDWVALRPAEGEGAALVTAVLARDVFLAPGGGQGGAGAGDCRQPGFCLSGDGVGQRLQPETD